MSTNWIITLLLGIITTFSCSACNNAEHDFLSSGSTSEVSDSGTVKLVYMGQATIRITTEDKKVIYIDPYSGDDYSLPADLILVTHEHFDHNAVKRVENRTPDCKIIRSNDAISANGHVDFKFDYVKVEPVQAGFNKLHSTAECVGFVLTFRNGKKVYISGDTSTTDQMRDGSMAKMNIDYAFLCTDGVYNMGNEEAASAAEMIAAKYVIPYHNSTTGKDGNFSIETAEKFNAPNKLLLIPGKTLEIK